MSTGTSTPNRQDFAEGAGGKAQEVAGQAQDKAQQAAEQAKSKLRDQIDQRSSQTGEQINQQASDLRAVGGSLREQGKDGPAQAADRLAQYAERVGGYLRDRDSQALLNDVEDYARRQPWAVGAGALALGFAAARFLKASSRERYSSRTGSPYGSSAPLAPQRNGIDGPGRVSPTPPPPAISPSLGATGPGAIPPTGV
jgi:hypothetical protein